MSLTKHHQVQAERALAEQRPGSYDDQSRFPTGNGTDDLRSWMPGHPGRPLGHDIITREMLELSATWGAHEEDGFDGRSN